MRKGEVVLNQKEFAKRRRQLMHTMDANAIAILPAATIRYRNRDAEYPFRQDSDFYYLTGFTEPEAVAVLVPEREYGEYILFCRERDPLMEVWNGRRAGPEGVREIDMILDEGLSEAELTESVHPDPGMRAAAWRVRCCYPGKP